MKNAEYLIPVDDYINTLQKEIDNIYWEDNISDKHKLPFLQDQLGHFLKLQESGVVYEPNF